MIQKFYSICGVIFQVSFEKEIWEDELDTLFQIAPEKPDLRLIVQASDDWELVSDNDQLNSHGQKVWLRDNLIYREMKDFFRPKAHMLLEYNPKELDNASVSVREAYWKWATRVQYFWPGIALNQLLLYFRTLIFHASYINYNGQGILFTAPSGTGKSTQAELWRKYRGTEIINGDKAGISLRDHPRVHGVPFSGTSGICENISLPLRAIVVLSQAPENRIRSIGPTEAVAALCSNVFVNKLVPTEWSMALNLLLDLVTQVPVYALACTPDERAVETLEEAIKYC